MRHVGSRPRISAALAAAGLTLLLLAVMMADRATPTGPHGRGATIGVVPTTPVGQAPLTPRSRAAHAVAGTATESSAVQPRTGGDAPAPGADATDAPATLVAPAAGSPIAVSVRPPTGWRAALAAGPDRAPPRLPPG